MKVIFHQAEFSARSDIFLLFKDQLAESGRQKTRNYHSARKIPPSGKRPLRPFSTRRNFPRGATFSFVWRPIGGEWASKDERKYHSARKIWPSGKRPIRTYHWNLMGVEEMLDVGEGALRWFTFPFYRAAAARSKKWPLKKLDITRKLITQIRFREKILIVDNFNY